MNKLLLSKILLTLGIIAVVAGYTYYNLSKTPTRSKAPAPIVSKQLTPPEKTKPETSMVTDPKSEKPALAKNSAEDSAQDPSQDSENLSQSNTEKPNRFLQDSDQAMADFENETIENSGWAYSMEQELYNIVTQEIYPDPDVLVVKDLKFECKTSACKMTTSQYRFDQLEPFYQHFFEKMNDRNIDITPIKMGTEETVMLLYPPKN